MAWRPVQELTTSDMIQLAARRHRVRLADGRIVTLVRWPRKGWGSARVETNRQARFSLRAIDVVEVDDEQLPESSGQVIQRCV